MSISLEGLVGFIRTRPNRTTMNRKDKDGKPIPPELELYIDQTIPMTKTTHGPKVSKPADCAGVLYSLPSAKDAAGNPVYRLEIQYPEE